MKGNKSPELFSWLGTLQIATINKLFYNSNVNKSIKNEKD